MRNAKVLIVVIKDQEEFKKIVDFCIQSPRIEEE